MYERKLSEINLERWQNTPHIKGRIATDEDVQEGIAVFRINGKGLEHVPVDINLPALAYHSNDETDERTPVIVVQSERVGDQEVAGIRYLDGGEGACNLWELEFTDHF
jgi:hypothetical protein